MNLANPYYLWLFLLFIPIIIWYVMKERKSHPTIAISTLSPFKGMRPGWRVWMRHVAFALKLGTIGCLIIILARPQVKDNWHTTSTEGTDIILAIDVSTSMLARDFKPDRFGASKEMASQFVGGRESDNIGVVIFAGESLTGVPMTVDHRQLIDYISNIHVNMLTDGTAIGDGIATSINRLKEGKAKSKSIILLTDGSNNTGVIAPKTASEVAKELGIKIYTIGIGTNAPSALAPSINEFGRMVFTPQPVVIDETTLKDIANTTGGRYFRATDNRTLQNIFQEIDRLEKTHMDVRHFSHTEDNYMIWAIMALGLFGLALLLKYTVLRSIP